jgi:predicted nuclease with RNAse H fold
MDNKFSSGHQTEQCKYVGIDVHLRRFTIACLDEDLQIQFIEDFSLDELLERIESVSPLIIGVDSPLGLNNGLMDDEQYRKKLRLETNTHHNKKVSEYELTRRGISLYSTPDSVDGVSGWKSWMGTGMQFFEKIKPMGYIHVNTNTDIDKLSR